MGCPGYKYLVYNEFDNKLSVKELLVHTVNVDCQPQEDKLNIICSVLCYNYFLGFTVIKPCHQNVRHLNTV